MLAEAPFVGQIKRDKYRVKYIWEPCPICSETRWVRLNKSGQLCFRCAMKMRNWNGECNPFYGKHHTEETRALISLRARQRPAESFRKSEAHKERISKALKGKKRAPLTEEHKRAISLGEKGRIQTEQMKGKVSLALKGIPKSEEARKNMKKPKSFVPPFSEEHRRKIGEANRRRWQYPGFAEKVLAKIRQATKPTQPEKYLDRLLNEYFPGEWKYVGDGKLIIEKKNPDFVNINGKKMLIELFGNYWHKKDEEYQKQQFYKQYGFGCLIIWQSELADPETVIEKVKDFSDG